MICASPSDLTENDRYPLSSIHHHYHHHQFALDGEWGLTETGHHRYYWQVFSGWRQCFDVRVMTDVPSSRPLTTIFTTLLPHYTRSLFSLRLPSNHPAQSSSHSPHGEVMRAPCKWNSSLWCWQTIKDNNLDNAQQLGLFGSTLPSFSPAQPRDISPLSLSSRFEVRNLPWGHTQHDNDEDEKCDD